MSLCCSDATFAEDKAAVARVRTLQSRLSAEDKKKALQVVAKRLEGNVEELNDPRREIRLELLSQIQTQRTRWAGRVIRRTNASLDNHGKSVMHGLPPLTIVTVLVTVSEPELQQISEHAEEATREYVPLSLGPGPMLTHPTDARLPLIWTSRERFVPQLCIAISLTDTP